MRIAVHPASEPGLRAARIILGERQLAELGMYRRSLSNPDDPRARPIRDLSGFDVLASDDVDDPLATATEALEAGVSCALWSDLPEDRNAARALGDEFAREGLTLLVGASLGTGIATALATHEVARTEETLELTAAWTVQGRPLRRGEPLPFPDPIGSRWGREIHDDDLPAPVPTRHFVAPVPGEWAGAMARITGVVDDGVGRRVVGVADHTGHLEGLSLAAAALTVATGAYRPGLQWPSTHEEYLENALAAGLAVATFTVEESSRERG